MFRLFRLFIIHVYTSIIVWITAVKATVIHPRISPIVIRRQFIHVDGIRWCPQELLPDYDHRPLRHCKSELLVSSSADYTEFEKAFCGVLTNHSMFVRFENVERYFYRGPNSRKSEYLNGAYMLLK